MLLTKAIQSDYESVCELYQAAIADMQARGV